MADQLRSQAVSPVMSRQLWAKGQCGRQYRDLRRGPYKQSYNFDARDTRRIRTFDTIIIDRRSLLLPASILGP